MTILEQVIKTAIEVTKGETENESRLTFVTKDDAETASEDLKEYWPKGFGQVYGPFVSGNKRWYEVSVPKQSCPVS